MKAASPDTVLVVHPGAELYGSDRVLLGSVTGLIREGWRVVVVLPAPGPLVAALTAEGAEVEFAPQFVLRKRLLRPRGWGDLLTTAAKGVIGAWGALRRHSPSVVLVNTITIPVWPLVARLRRVPTVVHVHEGESQARPWLKRVLYAPLLAAQRIIVNSRFSLAVMADSFACLAARSQVILNAVPGPETVTPPRPELVPGPRLAYIGRLSPRKGVDLIVSALRLLRDAGRPATLDLYGAVFPGYEWYEAELRSLIHSSDLTEAVTLHGFVDDVWPGLCAADIVVVPSRLDEPFGNTAVEGILAARPVVVSETSGLREATHGYATAFGVPAGSADALATAVARIADSWDAILPGLEPARAEAIHRHDPAAYGRAVAQVVAETAGPIGAAHTSTRDAVSFRA